MIETMIEVTSLTKRYGATKAIEDVSFQVRPGEVTGLLGPNGAGKSTTMAIILGLKSPTSGRALVAGRRYVDLPAPLRTVGALLEGAKAHPRHTVHSHLRWVAVSHGIARARVDEVVRTVGLERHVS